MKQRQKMFTLAAALATGGALARALLAGDPAPPQVSVADVNPGTSVERDLCLSVSLAPGAASECGDLRLAHALPAVRTLNRARAPVLLYNSQHASPHPIVAAHVTLPSGRDGLSRVVATLKVNGTPRGQSVWKGSAWPDVSGPVRIAVGYDAASDSTGPYRYTLEVRAHYGETMLADTARGELVVVNRRESVFGAGWWLAGLERLVMDPFGKPVLWVGGDGSTRRYTNAGGGDVWGAPSLDRPDSIKQTASGWERILGGGVKVEFDATGRHVATVNRLTHRTEFRYDPEGRVKALAIPHAGTGREFTFKYGGDGRLERTLSPGIDSARTVTVHRTGARIDAITDPDSTTVRFGYAGAGVLRIASRTDRRGYRTDFRYDGGFRLAGSKLWMDVQATGDSIVHHLRTAESAGLATSDGMGAVEAGRAYARLDGPRTDVQDTTALWLDRWGAPVRIVDAAGRETRLTRADPRFPGLVTRMDGPIRADGTRRTVSATYNARGNLEAQTDSSTFETRIVFDPADGHASNRTVYATTAYAYEEPHWPDHVTRVVQPEGETITLGYDSATGHRLWQQLGPDASRRVTFAYYSDPSEPGYAPGLLKAVLGPPPAPVVTPRQVCTGRDLECVTVEDTVYPPAPAERVEYDARGNLEYSITPKGYRTRYHNDDLGRTWKTEMPIDGTHKQVHQVTDFDAADRVRESKTTAPLRPGFDNAPQTLWVRNRYDDGGNLRFVERWSDPDVAEIQHVTTEFRYDAAGRKVAEVAPDGKEETTRYDAAGNPEWGLTRRGDTLRTRYDALNRPLVRYHSATRYEANRRGIPSLSQPPGTSCAVNSEIYQTYHSYPQFPSDTTDCSYTLPADSSVFAYDLVGNLVRADNGDALVRREYHLNGTLAWDSLYVRTLDGASGDPTSFAPHRYVNGYEYDLNGRRRSLVHPAQLAQGTNGRTRYTYAPGTGEPETVVDPLNNVFRYKYNAHGQLESLRLPGAVQGFAYDADGQLELSTVHVPSELATAPVNNTVYSYDQRGKMLRSRNLAVEKEEMSAAYSGLGHVVDHRRTATAQNQIEQLATQISGARYRHDALGNLRETINSTNMAAGSTGILTGSSSSSSGTTGGVSQYEAGTGRLLGTAQPGDDTQYFYDAAGNQLFETSTSTSTSPSTAKSISRRDRASFYSADGLLRTAEVRQLTEGSSPVHGTWEQYRYDALGRRVWVRTRRFCNEENPGEECGFSTVRRIVWDGDQVIHEIRMADSERENDGAPTRLERNSVTNWDPNPGLGRVLLTHGTGLDQPLSAIRMGYTEWASQGWGFAFSVIPLWDSRGRAPYAIFGNDARSGNGTRQLAHPAAQSQKLTTFWLLAWNAYGPRNNAAVLSTDQQHVVWMSSVMEDQQDASGLLYRRNRYYNPSAGRFTQEDPIGLAGGLNTYGFANGDPVSYSDPYGLCPQRRRDAEGFCPGGLSVAEWRNVESASNYLRADARTRALGLLNAGKIHGQDFRIRNHYAEASWSGEITFNRTQESDAYGSRNILLSSPRFLGTLLAHEIGHIVSDDGVTAGERFSIGLHNLFGIRTKAGVASQRRADEYARKNLRDDALKEWEHLLSH